MPQIPRLPDPIVIKPERASVSLNALLSEALARLQSQHSSLFIHEATSELSHSRHDERLNLLATLDNDANETDESDTCKQATNVDQDLLHVFDHSYSLPCNCLQFAAKLNGVLENLNVASSEFSTATFLYLPETEVSQPESCPRILELNTQQPLTRDNHIISGRNALCRIKLPANLAQATPETIAQSISDSNVDTLDRQLYTDAFTNNFKGGVDEFGQFICYYCNKAFSSKFSASRHEMLHAEDRSFASFSCKNCDKTFTAESSLLRHFSLVHIKERKYECSVCARKFGLQQYLDTHMRSHTGDRPYSCEFCDKAFKSKGNLNVHLLTHSSIRNWKCEFCDKSYKRHDKLRAHYRKHDSHSSYECRICAAAFYSRLLRREHMKDAHANYKPRCKLCKKTFAAVKHLKKHHCSGEASAAQGRSDCESASVVTRKRRRALLSRPALSRRVDIHSESSEHSEQEHLSPTPRQLTKVKRASEKRGAFVSFSGSGGEEQGDCSPREPSRSNERLSRKLASTRAAPLTCPY